MTWFSKAAVAGLLWLGFSAFAFGDTLYITGQTESVLEGGQFSAYLASDPGQPLLIYCVDFQNYDQAAASVNISVPDVSNPSSVADTRYGNTPTADFSAYNSAPTAISAVERYVLAAYLTTQYNFASGVTTADDEIQDAIWTLLDTDGTSGFPGGDSLGTGGYIAQALNWFAAAQNGGTLTSFENDIRVFTSTDTASYTTGSQEMIAVSVTPVLSAPEPATLAMLGLGLLAIGIFRGRMKT